MGLVSSQKREVSSYWHLIACCRFVMVELIFRFLNIEFGPWDETRKGMRELQFRSMIRRLHKVGKTTTHNEPVNDRSQQTTHFTLLWSNMWGIWEGVHVEPRDHVRPDLGNGLCHALALLGHYSTRLLYFCYHSSCFTKFISLNGFSNFWASQLA